ncbi:MAG: glycogen debranching protein [Acidobacteriaceae bacterium]|nr:glycogen debranching protein [Acidobacteriaceae bacterium]
MRKIALILAFMAGSYSMSGQNVMYKSSKYAVSSDGVTEGPYSASAVSSTELHSNYPTAKREADGTARWRLQSDISSYPQLRSDYLLVDALYNLSLDELHLDVRPDQAFMAGAKWDGVWTRDISYSILLALAAVEPDVAKRSLLAKVKRDRIVQDTGTGGSWPVSTDRMVWALAAWEVYEVTGDRDWLKRSFEIVSKSAADDEKVIFAHNTGLVNGESSFMDWREQTYPAWMDPVDIYTSQDMGTNAVHYQTYRILAEMAKQLGQPAERYAHVADQIRSSINQWLWLKGSGYYGQYLYGRNNLTLSPRSDALGEALSVLFDIATPENQDRILQSVPVMEYGIPCVYPQTVGIRPYHNDSVWPFVEAFWGLAGAKRQNDAIVLQSFASIYRAAALFLTNKENMVASTGSNAGTQIKSYRQLWSVAGNLALVYRILFGMKFSTVGLTLQPVIPAELNGQYVLSNFHYRNAVLTLRIQGHGSSIKSFKIDGRAAKPLVEPDLAGKHEVEIQMVPDHSPATSARIVNDAVAPATPTVHLAGGSITWSAVQDAEKYHIYRNAKLASTTSELMFAMSETQAAEYQVSAVDGQGRESFLSEPVEINSEAIIVRANEAAEERIAGGPPGASRLRATRAENEDAIQLDRDQLAKFALEVTVPVAGRFDIKFRYANGSGPINTDNKCAIRTLFVDGQRVGAIVMPQRGEMQWSNFGFSSVQSVDLKRGRHVVELRFEPEDQNMNQDVNRVLLDSVHLQLHP